MIVYIGLVVVSAFLVHTAGTWAYIFFVVLREGEFLVYEPNRTILMAEFGIAVFLTLLGFFFLVATIVGLKKQADRRRGKSEGGKSDEALSRGEM